MGLCFKAAESGVMWHMGVDARVLSTRKMEQRRQGGRKRKYTLILCLPLLATVWGVSLPSLNSQSHTLVSSLLCLSTRVSLRSQWVSHRHQPQYPQYSGSPILRDSCQHTFITIRPEVRALSSEVGALQSHPVSIKILHCHQFSSREFLGLWAVGQQIYRS